jgi:uncharacterized protein YgiM (DUF1202 family)
MRKFSTGRSMATLAVAAVSALTFSAVAVPASAASATTSGTGATVGSAGPLTTAVSASSRWIARDSTRLTNKASRSSRVVSRPGDGRRVTVLERSNGRIKVRVAGGKVGWTSRVNLTSVPLADVKGTRYTKGEVVVRKGFKSSTKRVTTLRLGTAVKRMARTTEGRATKVKVRLADGRVGWVPSSRLTTRNVWRELGRCESGGNPRTNTGNGYYGLYQFTSGTWRSVGGRSLPHRNSAAEQTKRAQILQDRAGWGQWPACTRKLGLR